MWIEIVMLDIFYVRVLGVIPHVGMWIEIKNQIRTAGKRAVIPHVGMWIEIRSARLDSILVAS